MSENYCPHCMRPASGGKCPHCGGDTSWRGQKGIDLPVGTVLNGGNGLRTYQIGAARGKGGFGITYVALETNSGRRVAVKEYFPTRCAFRAGNEVSVQTMSGQEDVFRAGMNSFLEEGKMLLSQDDLSCVVHVIDYFRANGTAYLVMEYLDGVALHTQMTQMGGRIPVSELMPRLAPLIRDIGQLHRRGVIHRDISPDNIMWMPDGTLKLLDFGSARSMESGKSMTVLMKHGFSPIEQYRSKGQGPYTDIYALAATIYYCVTGAIPPAAVERLEEDGLQSPVALGAALTVDQETALLWALSIQPNARPQSMEEFASMLYHVSPGPIPPRPEPMPPRPEPMPPTPGPMPPTPGPMPPTPGPTPPTPGPTPPTPGPTPVVPGSRSKLPILIGGIAAAVVVLIAVVIIAMSGDDSTAVNPTYTIAPAPTFTFSLPTAAPTPNIRTGIIDGFYYELIESDHAVLTGYMTGANFGYMPDDVDGVPITEIADGAFAGASTGGIVNLPIDLETIGANAFRGCADLSYVYAYSDVSTGSSSFSECYNLWLVLSTDKNTSGWSLPGGVSLCYYGMETGAGTLDDASWSGDMLLGETTGGSVVLLGVEPGMASVDLEDVDWICSGALDNLAYGGTVNLGDETLYSYETFLNSTWTWSAPDGVLSDMWLLTCTAAWEINNARPSGAAQIEPDLDLIYAAMVAAEQYTEPRDINYRQDGMSWDTILTEKGIRYNFRSWAAGYNYDDCQAVLEGTPGYMAENFASITQGDYAGQYYSRIGMATAQQSDGLYTWWGFVTIS